MNNDVMVKCEIYNKKFGIDIRVKECKGLKIPLKRGNEA